MLYLVAYDIANPRRLARVADICEDYGTRVQYSLFECWLGTDEFALFWNKLQSVILHSEDRVAAYVLDASAARSRLRAGDTMIGTEKETYYHV